MLTKIRIPRAAEVLCQRCLQLTIVRDVPKMGFYVFAEEETWYHIEIRIRDKAPTISASTAACLRRQMG